MTINKTQEHLPAPDPAQAATGGASATIPISAQPVPPREKSRAPRRRTGLRTVARVLVVLALLAGAAAGGTYMVRERLAARAFVSLGAAVLTVPALPVGSAYAAVVTNILVTEGKEVTAGQEIARVMTAALGANLKPQAEILRAPINGTVSSVNVGVGGVARAAEPIVTLYEKAKLAFYVNVPVEKLRQLQIGMIAYIEGPGLNRRIPTTVDRVVPRVGKDAVTANGEVAVVLVPREGEMAMVRTLIPGLIFSATADTKTAGNGTPALNGAP
jgi:multidrug resistance efflux pump